LDDDVKIEHESFGLLSFSRTQSNMNKHLFGSSIKHNNTIHLKISNCEENRGLNRYWYFERDLIVDVEMSYSQFAEAIVAMNTTGVPCTIRKVLDKKMEDCPGESQRELFEKEFQGKVLDITDRLKYLKFEADELIQMKGTLKVKDKERLSNLLHMIVMEVRQNLPFIQKSYNEAMDKTTMEAKTEIESFINHQVVTLGLDAFKKQFQQIGSKTTKAIDIDSKEEDNYGK